METRNISLTLKEAKKWYNSDNESLKELALQTFTKDELTFNFKNIRTAANLFISQMKLEGWLPIKEYFNMKKLGIELDWVMVLTMENNGFIAIPKIAEYCSGSKPGWYDYNRNYIDDWTNVIMFKLIETRNTAEDIRTKLFNEYKEKECIKTNSDFENDFNEFLIKHCKY